MGGGLYPDFRNLFKAFRPVNDKRDRPGRRGWGEGEKEGGRRIDGRQREKTNLCPVLAEADLSSQTAFALSVQSMGTG